MIEDEPQTVTKKPESGPAVGDEWKCSSCTRVDESIPMIGCDSCDSWFHWSCVGVVAEPRKEDVWICSDCRRVKPLKKSKDKFRVSSSSRYSGTLSSTRPSSGSSSGKSSSGPIVKTGSGHLKKSSSKTSSSAITASVTNVAVAAGGVNTKFSKEITSLSSDVSSKQQGWMCASCRIRFVKGFVKSSEI